MDLLPGYLRTHWRYFVQTATWIVAIVGLFLLLPPELSSVWSFLGRFIVAAVTGLLAVPIVLYARKQHTWRWWIASAACLVLGVTLVSTYLYERQSWTTEYGNGRVVIGKTYLDSMKQWIKDNVPPGEPDPTPHELIMNDAGNAEAIWLPEEIASRRKTLIGMYFGGLLLLTSGMLCLPQALHCARQRQQRIPRDLRREKIRDP